MLDAAESQLVRLNRWVVIALMAAMAVLVFANVVSRYLFNFSIIWVEELTRYMMVWVGFIGSGLVLRFGAHIAV
jgi:TRAP-type C4-dicarboxylate transport system permease small subunit